MWGNSPLPSVSWVKFLIFLTPPSLYPLRWLLFWLEMCFKVHQEHEMQQYIDLIKVQIKDLSSDSEALPGINPPNEYIPMMLSRPSALQTCSLFWPHAHNCTTPGLFPADNIWRRMSVHGHLGEWIRKDHQHIAYVQSYVFLGVAGNLVKFSILYIYRIYICLWVYIHTEFIYVFESSKM